MSKSWQKDSQFSTLPHSSNIRGVAIVKPGFLVSCDKQGIVKLWNYINRCCIKSIYTQQSNTSIVGLRDSSRLFLYAIDKILEVDLTTGQIKSVGLDLTEEIVSHPFDDYSSYVVTRRNSSLLLREFDLAALRVGDIKREI